MNRMLYETNAAVQSGVTMKDMQLPENNNTALHACKSAEDVIENRRQLARSLGCRLEDFVFAEQTHSANFYRVSAADRGRGAFGLKDAVKNTDALYTFEKDIVLCSMSADCVPVSFYSTESPLTGVIHSGWQGTVKEITKKLFEHLQQTEQCNVQSIYVQIGPALSQEKFEVDRDVCEKFQALGYADPFIMSNQETGKYHIDNQLTVKRQCELAGIPAGHIHIDRTCTYLHEGGFSYRQNKQCGRHTTFIRRLG